MKKDTCANCFLPVKTKGSFYCRKCYVSLSVKTKRNCSQCNKPLSISAAATRGKLCRSCYDFHRSHQSSLQQDKFWLQEHYINQKLSLEACAKLANCGRTTIEKWIRRFNIPMRSQGEWKGGKSNVHGYRLIYIPSHPRSNVNRPYVSEHVLVMEKYLGRYVSKQENVHHKNGIRNDNRLENLQLFPSASAHKIYEGWIQQFAKQLLWGDLEPKMKQDLQNLFTHFLSMNGYDISA